MFTTPWLCSVWEWRRGLELIELREKTSHSSDAQKTTLNAVVGKCWPPRWRMRMPTGHWDVPCWDTKAVYRFSLENLHIATPVMFQEDILNGHLRSHGMAEIREGVWQFVSCLSTMESTFEVLLRDPIDDWRIFQKILLVEYARFYCRKRRKRRSEMKELFGEDRTDCDAYFALLWCLGVGFCVVFMHLNRFSDDLIHKSGFVYFIDYYRLSLLMTHGFDIHYMFFMLIDTWN